MSIEVKNLTKIYGKQKAVDDISFAVNNGEIVGFLGPNGAGKSTTMKIITGFLESDGGDAFVTGVKVSADSIATKKKIGYLPEANPLYHEMYVREYLQFIAGVHGLKNAAARIEEVINITGLTVESNKKVGQLSKGYKQRVGLAAALIHDPEVLILDEPTSGLDPNQIVEVREVIKNLGKNKTVLFSTHILQEVEAICDRVIIINKGKIVANDQLSKLRGSLNTQSVTVQFKEAVDENILKEINGVNEIEKLQGSGYTYRIKTNEPELIRKQLMQLSLQHNLNVVSLQSENNLEEIFKSLTLNIETT